MLMAENHRTGFVWEQFMKNEEAKRGMERAGFHLVHSQASTVSSTERDELPKQAQVSSRDSLEVNANSK
jgi:hypothetical protein